MITLELQKNKDVSRCDACEHRPTKIVVIKLYANDEDIPADLFICRICIKTLRKLINER